MAKNPGIRKTIEVLLKKVETLENESFAQKLAIDELENKLQQAETLIKQVQENPFGIVNIPNIWTNPPAPVAMPPSQLQPNTLAPPQQYPHNVHTCVGGLPDWAGSIYCVSCGVHMSGASWTVTSTSDQTTLCLADPTSQSSTGVEDTQEFDISWILPFDPEVK